MLSCPAIRIRMARPKERSQSRWPPSSGVQRARTTLKPQNVTPKSNDQLPGTNSKTHTRRNDPKRYLTAISDACTPKYEAEQIPKRSLSSKLTPFAHTNLCALPYLRWRTDPSARNVMELTSPLDARKIRHHLQQNNHSLRKCSARHRPAAFLTHCSRQRG